MWRREEGEGEGRRERKGRRQRSYKLPEREKDSGDPVSRTPKLKAWSSGVRLPLPGEGEAGQGPTLGELRGLHVRPRPLPGPRWG